MINSCLFSEISWTNIWIRAWISNYIHVKQQVKEVMWFVNDRQNVGVGHCGLNDRELFCFLPINGDEWKLSYKISLIVEVLKKLTAYWIDNYTGYWTTVIFRFQVQGTQLMLKLLHRWVITSHSKLWVYSFDPCLQPTKTYKWNKPWFYVYQGDLSMIQKMRASAIVDWMTES